MRTIIDNKIVECDETIEFKPIEFVRNIYGNLVVLTEKKYIISLVGFIEFFDINILQTYNISPKTLITSDILINNSTHHLIENNNNHYIYRLNLQCKLLHFSINDYKCHYIFEEL